MGMNFTKTVASYGVAIWQKIHDTAQGGFRLDLTGLTLGDTIKAGTLVSFDESTRIATVIKSATVQANAANNAVNIRVAKGHQFKVGDYVARSLGGTAYAITAISTTDPAYDQLTIGTTLGVALTVGDALFISTATGSTAGATLTPKGLLYEDYKVSTNVDVAVVTRGTVYARRIPAITDDLKAKIQSIFFSQSY